MPGGPAAPDPPPHGKGALQCSAHSVGPHSRPEGMALAKCRHQRPTPLIVGKEVTGTVTLFITNLRPEVRVQLACHDAPHGGSGLHHILPRPDSGPYDAVYYAHGRNCGQPATCLTSPIVTKANSPHSR